MTQPIDPIKLKAAAEHLEWVLRQYPDNEDVRGLLQVLLPLIEEAKDGKVLESVKSADIPGVYNFGDGVYVPYRNPDVGGAYADFLTQMDGGPTDIDRKIEVYIEAAKAALKGESGHG
ncbi:MAG: hypothetical protein ABI129_08950 [Rhodanobacter sp.]